MTAMVNRRTIPIVVDGATFSVTLRWNEGDLDGFDVDRIEPNGGSTWDMQPYLQDDIREAINEKCVELLDEIVASGFNEDDRGW